MPARTIGTELGELIVELNLHPHGPRGSTRCGSSGCTRPGWPGSRIVSEAGIEHLITPSPFKHPDNALYPGLGAMLPAQSGAGRGILIEYWCSLIRFCR